MKHITIIIIIVIFAIIIYINRHNDVEHLTNVSAEETKTQDLNKQKIHGANNFLGNNRTQQIDELYETAETYENEEGREGLDICLEKCRGNCVEFGIHGKAFCFK